MFVAAGPMTRIALDAAALLAEQGITSTVIDPRWVIPVAKSVVELAGTHRLVVSIEDGLRVGGVGTSIRQAMRDAGVDTGVSELGTPYEFLEHATREELLEDAGLTAPQIAAEVAEQVRGERVPTARPE
ncbi:1-deoxy-D-xylulose-5-phosphate synthase [Leucobacter sp. BZR 635]